MQNAFLVRLSISQWSARKLDKSATREAKDRAGAGEKAGVKVYKSVIAADALDAIESIAGAARNEHRKRTVPWAYDGPGAITAEGYPAYKAAMATYEKDFRNAVAHFYNVYEAEREAAREYLGNMFNPSDYPAISTLGERFAFSVTAEPMPQADDFRVQGLAPDLVADIKRDMVENNVNAMQNANATAWQRVIEHVEKLKMRLEEYTRGEVKKFYDSWLDNISELVTLLPSINVANDPNLTRIGQKLVALTAYTSKDLKESESLRTEICKQASLVLAQIGEAYRNAA